MSSTEICFWALCVVPLGKEVPRLFGFAEFISSLALMVIVFTITDIRYRFRIAIAPSRLYGLTYGLIAFIGAATLLTEVWLAEGWWVPRSYLTRSVWQACLGALFLGVFMTWVWYAFIRPPVFGRRNAKRYAQSLFRIIVKGSDTELSVIADELGRSARRLIAFAPPVPARNSNEPHPMELENAAGYAYDVLLLIANRKLCRHIVASAPGTAIGFFEEAVRAEKYQLPLGQFATNISGEALSNTDSILYHEGDRFSSDLLGAVKPFSRTLYGNFDLVEALATNFASPLDIRYQDQSKWTSQMWDMYCSATLLTLNAYLETTRQPHSYALSRAFQDIENSISDLYKLNDAGDDFYLTDVYQRFRVVVRFAANACDAVGNAARQPYRDKLRLRKDEFGRSIYDQLAGLMFEVVFAASSVTRPVWTAWTLQHNDVWSSFMTRPEASATWKTVQFKLRRLLYNELLGMPNFKGARILGYCLNVMGLRSGTGTYGREHRPLVKAVHAWTKKNYRQLHEKYPKVAEAVLIGSVSYDHEHNRLVKTYREGLSGARPEEYLQLNGRGTETRAATLVRKVKSRRPL